MQERVGQRIQQRRKALGLSQTVLAAKLGITQSALSKIERGSVASSIELIQKISTVLEIPSTTLIHEFEADNNQNEDFFGEDTLSDLRQSMDDGRYSEVLQLVRRVSGAVYFQSPEHKAELRGIEAHTLMRLGKLDKAEQICVDIVNKCKPYLARKSLAEIYNILGSVYYHRKEYTNAVSVFEASHRLVRDKHPDSTINIMSMIRLAMCYARMKDEGRSTDMLNKVSEVIFTRLDFFKEYDALTSLIAAEITRNIDDNTELSISFLERSLNGAWAIGSVRGQFRVCNRLRKWYREIGRTDKADEYEKHFQRLVKKYPEEARIFLMDT